MPPVLFASQSYQSRSPQLSSEQLINGFVEQQPPDAKSQVPIFGIPGMVKFATVGVGPVRGMLTMGTIGYDETLQSLFVVSGDSLYFVSNAGVVSFLGSGIFGDGRVGMAENGHQLVVVNGHGGWIYDNSMSTFAKITDPNFHRAFTVTFFDEYFVFDRAATNQFFISGILDGNSYGALDFASAESSAKPIVGIVQNIQLLYIFSQDHFEIWYDAGASDFPFARYTGGVVWRGCAAPYSIILQDQTIFFLGNDGIFYRVLGSAIERISTHSIETFIQQELDVRGELRDVHCMTETLEGHKFVYLTLPHTKQTFGYDTTTQMWHKRVSYDAKANSLDRWRVNCSIAAYGMTFYGDYTNGNLYYRDWTVSTEDGNVIKLIARSKPYHQDKKRLINSRFELDMQVGVASATGQGSDPEVMLRYSKDGGETWSQLQPWRSMGKVGGYLKRLRWLRLGSAYVWVYEIEISDPVQRVIIAAHAEFEEGM